MNIDAEHAVLTSHCRGTSQQRNVNVVTVYDIQNKFIGTNEYYYYVHVAAIVLCFKQVACIFFGFFDQSLVWSLVLLIGAIAYAGF